MPDNAWERMKAPDAEGVGEGQRLGIEPLASFFARTPRLAVAFSGGVDSAYLLAAAVRAGCAVKAYQVDTPFQPAFELADAREVLARLSDDGFSVPHEVIGVDILSCVEVCANAPDRCYRCKGVIFDAIRAAATRDGFPVVADGTNATDDPARRPGFAALRERGVASPLRRAGLTKADVRAASRALALPTADKPRFSCLATRVPQGEALTARTLAQAAHRLGLGGKVVLETERLVLREMTPADAPALARVLQDDAAMYAYEGAFDDAGVQAWLDNQLRRYREDGFGLWLAVLKRTGRAVGQCGVTWQDGPRGDKVLEVGYLLERAWWHKGLATEAARACRDWAFEAQGAAEVFSIVRDANAPSRVVAKRNGMTARGVLVKHYRGAAMPHVAYSMTRDEWEAERAGC